MGIQLTTEQQKVVDAKTSNILVAAAAGSGKTAVLVERIMKKICDREHPVDIDEILIVTFTIDAASQMRDRIRKAIDLKLADNPYDDNLLRQSERLNFASIMTLDAFCAEAVKRNFQALNIDPSFRILEDAEGKILREQAIEEVIEEFHEAGNPLFFEMLEMYSGNRNDSELRELLKDLIEFANSSTYPNEWLRSSANHLLAIQTYDDLQNSVFMKHTLDSIKTRLQSAVNHMSDLLELCHKTAGPWFYEDTFTDDIAFLNSLIREPSFAQIGRMIKEHKFARIASAPKKEPFNQVWKEYAQAQRDIMKKTVADIEKSFFKDDVDRYVSDIQNCAPAVSMLCELAIACRGRMRQKMDEVNAYDFSEVEHMTLDLFLENHDGVIAYTDIARKYRSFFKEIMVDEYQDSNYVQEFFLKAVSGEDDGKPNMFMVGDIKQSIYRFRMARPELFVGKYDSFDSDEGSANRKILLNRNFRSRKIILDGVNRVFAKIMMKSIGDVEYDENAFLKYRKDEGPDDNEEPYHNEILLVKQDEVESKGNAEIAAIIKRIRELTHPVNGLRISDDNGGHTARFSDIAILTKTRSPEYYSLINQLNASGIPAYATESSGYFESEEISNVLAYLEILDNPLQDIPFATVLVSPMVGFDYDELALLRVYATEKEKSTHTDYSFTVLRELCNAEYLQECYFGIRQKGKAFLRFYDSLKEKSLYLSVPELITELLRMTGYLDYVSVMPSGSIRERNLRMLVEKAKDFTNGIFTELSDFVRYIGDMKKYQISPSGECADAGNAVRMLTIHGSKGLEYPIVFLFQADKSLLGGGNDKKDFVWDTDLGIGAVSRYVDRRIQSHTFAESSINYKERLDSTGEAVRLYYVALTRAKEKLIVVGGLKISEWTKYIGECVVKRNRLIYEYIYGAPSFLSLLLRSVLPEADEESLDKARPIGNLWSAFPELICKEWVVIPQGNEVFESLKIAKEDISKLSQEAQEESIGLLREYFNYQYQHVSQDIPMKVTVSALKKSAMEEYAVVYDHPNVKIEHAAEEEPMPAFISSFSAETNVTGAMTGTFYHRLLELHDYRRDGSVEDCIKEAEELVSGKYVDKAVLSAVSFQKLSNFYKSDIGIRLKNAYEKGTLKREQAFVMDVPANLVSEEYDCNEKVLVQGIIDAFFREDDGIVLLDYKTDRVPKGEDEQYLIARYKLQLRYYADAIRRATGENVKESLIYSFALQKLIRL